MARARWAEPSASRRRGGPAEPSWREARAALGATCSRWSPAARVFRDPVREGAGCPHPARALLCAFCRRVCTCARCPLGESSSDRGRLASAPALCLQHSCSPGDPHRPYMRVTRPPLGRHGELSAFRGGGSAPTGPAVAVPSKTPREGQAFPGTEAGGLSAGCCFLQKHSHRVGSLCGVHTPLRAGPLRRLLRCPAKERQDGNLWLQGQVQPRTAGKTSLHKHREPQANCGVALQKAFYREKLVARPARRRPVRLRLGWKVEGAPKSPVIQTIYGMCRGQWKMEMQVPLFNSYWEFEDRDSI